MGRGQTQRQPQRWPRLLLLQLAVLFLLHDGACALTTLKKGSWTILDVTSDSPQYFAYTTPNPGQACSTLDCTSGDRWFRFSAHTQAYQLRVNTSASLQSLLCTFADQLQLQCQSRTGSSAAVLGRYGQYSNDSDDECYTEASRWSPSPNATVFFSVELLINSSDAQIQHAASHSVSVGVAVNSYGVSFPIPGGCAMEGPTPNDPMAQIGTHNADTNKITFQQADFGVPYVWSAAEHHCACDAIPYYSGSLNQATLQYDVYQTFLGSCGSDFQKSFDPNALLHRLGQLQTVANVQRYGTKINAQPILPAANKELDVDVVVGQGVVYSIVVTDLAALARDPSADLLQYQSVYAPSHTYSCSFTGEEGLPSCEHLRDDIIMGESIVAAIIGLVMALFGLRCYPWTAMIMTALGFVFMTFILLTNFATGLDYEGEAKIFTNNFNYAMCFVCLTLVFPTLMLIRPTALVIISSSVVGGFMVFSGADYFSGSSFAEVYTNVVQRAVDQSYAAGYAGSYFAEDFNGCANLELNIIMLVAWAVLVIICIGVQVLCTARRVKHVPTFKEWSKRKQRRRMGRIDPRETQPLINADLVLATEAGPGWASPASARRGRRQADRSARRRKAERWLRKQMDALHGQTRPNEGQGFPMRNATRKILLHRHPDLELYPTVAAALATGGAAVRRPAKGKRQKHSVLRMLRRHARKHSNRSASPASNMGMSDVAERVLMYTEDDELLPDAVRHRTDDLGMLCDEDAGSFFGFLYRIIGLQANRSLAHGRALMDWTTVLEDGLCYLAGMPGTTGVPNIKGFQPLVYLKVDECWTWSSKPIASAQGLLAILSTHFLQTVHEAKHWSECMQAYDEMRRAQLSMRREEAARAKMKHLTLDEADEEELEEMRRQEKERFSKPHLDYTYKLKCGGIPYTVRVPKLKGFTAEKTARMSKARPHAILEDDRPSCVTLTYVIMDTLARCPSQRALKQDICRYAKTSRYVRATADVTPIAVGGALDRLQTEPRCVCQYESNTKHWMYRFDGYNGASRPMSPSAIDDADSEDFREAAIRPHMIRNLIVPAHAEGLLLQATDSPVSRSPPPRAVSPQAVTASPAPRAAPLSKAELSAMGVLSLARMQTMRKRIAKISGSLDLGGEEASNNVEPSTAASTS
ncbi:uncharacterized protein MONBRDRAFT_31894 [Monosiga brevicollis MX1]|uniref:DUF4203 domain-containing protein n=1 Tax=Monosiga brevicollis TaxID=81824 RepID=A9UW38_MONBE|nr:uncharacterized protein MONBRDRAFT_31894 [Monosiga brevicollis MX1]EDQ90701.1 predicted protein [Monosiga brevicollis MX1]|eukprot:XP_001744752.1 hypothetical protein [Monosiga brevicollis MX1]